MPLRGVKRRSNLSAEESATEFVQCGIRCHSAESFSVQAAAMMHGTESSQTRNSLTTHSNLFFLTEPMSPAMLGDRCRDLRKDDPATSEGG